MFARIFAASAAGTRVDVLSIADLELKISQINEQLAENLRAITAEGHQGGQHPADAQRAGEAGRLWHQCQVQERARAMTFVMTN